MDEPQPLSRIPTSSRRLTTSQCLLVHQAGYGVLDTGWAVGLKRHEEALAKFGHLVEEMELTPRKFRYGNGPTDTDEAIGKVKVPCFIQGRVFIVFFVALGDVPMLVSKRCQYRVPQDWCQGKDGGAGGWLVSAGPHGRHHPQGDRPARG